MSKYVYPAIISKDEDGYCVSFPDIDGCYTDGDTLADAIENAEDALCLMLYDMEEDGKELPVASDVKSISTEENQIISLVACDTLEYRQYYDNKAVKKTLTIPNWLNVMAEKRNVNFSQTLQEALISQLGITR